MFGFLLPVHQRCSFLHVFDFTSLFLICHAFFLTYCLCQSRRQILIIIQVLLWLLPLFLNPRHPPKKNWRQESDTIFFHLFLCADLLWWDFLLQNSGLLYTSVKNNPLHFLTLCSHALRENSQNTKEKISWHLCGEMSLGTRGSRGKLLGKTLQ